MAQRRTRSVRWVLVISCMIAVHSSQISNIILGRKRSKRPAHPAINFHIQPSQQKSDQESKIADVESAIEQVNLEIDSTESKIEQVESDIEQVNEQLKTATGADRDFFRKKELSLRDNEQSLRDKHQSLRDKEQSLREGLLLLMKDDQRDASADTSLSQNIPTAGNPQAMFVPKVASSFVASKGNHCITCLYNGMKVITFNLPPAARQILDTQFEANFELNARQTVLNGLVKNMFPVCVPETGEALTVESTIGNQLCEYFTCHEEPALGFSIKKQLALFGADYGPTGSSSISDGVAYTIVDNQMAPLLCVELKDTTTSPIEPIGQAFASGSNIALRQKQLGLDSSKIAVPLILTNGHLFSFATASLLDNMPVLHMVTNVLDANTPSDLVEIACMLARIKAFIKSKAREIQQCAVQRGAVAIGVPVAQFEFDKDKFFVKSKDKIYNRFNPLDSENGALPLLWDVFEALGRGEGVEKALGYCDLKLVGKPAELFLVFHNLLRQGYRMGVPEVEGDYRLFLAALEALVHQVHACGVVHVDLYPSNIMWAKVDGTVRIRIVDWDAATFAGQPFPGSMLRRLEEEFHYVYVDESRTASPKSDAWNVFLMSNLNAAERAPLALGDAPAVNLAYRTFINKEVARHGSVLALRAAFLEWFEGFQRNALSPPTAAPPSMPPPPPSPLQMEA